MRCSVLLLIGALVTAGCSLTPEDAAALSQSMNQAGAAWNPPRLQQYYQPPQVMQYYQPSQQVYCYPIGVFTRCQ